MKDLQRSMMSLAIFAAVLACRSSSIAQERSDAKPQRAHQLELGGRIGTNVIFADPANPEYQSSYNRWGYNFGLTFLYRSAYFLRPFLDVSYASLANGDANIPANNWGGPATVKQSLGVWNFSPGVAIDVWRLRLFATLGLSSLSVTNTVNGNDNGSSQLAVSSQLGLSGLLYEFKGTHLRADARFVNIPGADTRYLSLAIAIDTELLR